MRCLAGALAAWAAMSAMVWADPCGMVPPIYVGEGVPIVRVGEQKTYAFFKDGVETFVIRPGFEGKVEEFGMLIPFPSVPAIRKVSDSIFPHIAAAIDPPEVVVYAYRGELLRRQGNRTAGPAPAANASGLKLGRDEVRVVKEEAVGMYEVAVLEAGSAAALNKWMDEHGYKYPKGMDDACEEYVELGWCFVAVKTRVGAKAGIEPKPGQRQVDAGLPAGATFDGHVQAMGFRFKVDELVVPMRLSAFNAGELHNVVYVLTDRPQKIRSIPEEYVVRQVAGEQLIRNVTDPLPLRIIGGTAKDLQPWQKEALPAQRNPEPHNAAARDLFASDLLAVQEDRLAHPHEETEKMYLRIGERLSLRGPEIDALNEGALEDQRKKIVAAALKDLKGMTLSVIDGNFPRELLGDQNLTFASYRMPPRRNSPAFYDAKQHGPAPQQQGVLHYGKISLNADAPGRVPAGKVARGAARRAAGWAASAALVVLALAVTLRRRGRAAAALLTGLTAWAASSAVLAQDQAEEPRQPAPASKGSEANKSENGKSAEDLSKLDNLALIDRLADPKVASGAADELIRRGEKVVPDLLGEAFEGNDLVLRGWAVVCLAEIGGEKAEERLTELSQDAKQPALVRTWAAAGRVKLAESTDELLKLAELIPQFPALGRPVGLRLVAKLNEKGETITAEDLLDTTLKVPQLQQSLAPAILAMGSKPLVEAMATARDQNVRRQAAAYLGTLAAQGDKNVAGEVVEAYEFDPNAKTAPWEGGPLFIPGIDWQKDDARKLVDHLIRWYLWTELNEHKQHQAALHNNLRSVQLAQVAGYQSPGFQEVGVDQWLETWGRAIGKEQFRKLLDQQGAANLERYKKILERLD
ncbi:MAG: DUF2330 domain-containing protein [Planctomycetes bacterium]|nr:DUF2330 domain-containing protein [Planctomycetota bacterium]